MIVKKIVKNNPFLLPPIFSIASLQLAELDFCNPIFLRVVRVP